MDKATAEQFSNGIGKIAEGSVDVITSAFDMGVPQALGLSRRDWVVEYLGGWTRLQVDDRRKVALQLSEEGRSQREIADALGVGVGTVSRDLNGSVPDGTPDGGLDAVPDEGNDETAPNGTPGTDNAEDGSSESRSRVHILTGEVEWYTPKEYIDSARIVMGTIDLDPATSDIAQKIVKAARYFTRDDDGLVQEWSGNVWLNPPYAAKLITAFVQKLIDEPIQQAILLTNNATDTGWWHNAARHASAICFHKGRIQFYREGDDANSPTHGQTFFYFGANADEFTKEFGQYGIIR